MRQSKNDGTSSFNLDAASRSNQSKVGNFLNQHLHDGGGERKGRVRVTRALQDRAQTLRKNRVM